MNSLSLAVVLAAAGCADDDDAGGAVGASTLELTISGLEALDTGAYEGWLIYGDDKVSTGTFVDPAQASLTTDLDPSDADAFVLTIEPTPDSDPAPSGVVVLEGAVRADGSGAELAFGAGFEAASGGFILRTPTDDVPSYELSLSASGLEDLTQGVYEGWLVVGDDKISTGTFSSVGEVVMTTDVDPSGADAFVVTIEPDDDDDPAPSGIVVLSGTPGANDVPTDLGFGVDLTMGSGGFILRTPTDDGDTPMANDEAGIWFLEVGQEGPMAGLELPTLPDGWVYEGWVVTQGVPLTTGRFSDPAAADMGSPYSEGGPPFPGEDFLMDLPDGVAPPVDLTDGASTVVISVEPDLDGADPTGAGPFAIKPWAREVPADHPVATFTTLGTGPVPTASGTLTVTESVTSDNDEAGVWFLEMGSAGPMAGLSLPTLPQGWVYEGWAVTQGIALSSGRFVDPAAADLAAPYSAGGPPFPGEDFLMGLPSGVTPPVDLSDGASTIVISVEPDIDGADPSGDGPFAIKPLALEIPADHPTATFTPMAPGPTLAPSGSVDFLE